MLAPVQLTLSGSWDCGGSCPSRHTDGASYGALGTFQCCQFEMTGTSVEP